MKNLKFVIQSLATGVHYNGQYACKGHNNTIGFVAACHLGHSGFKFDTKEEAIEFFKTNIQPRHKYDKYFAIRTLDTTKCGHWMSFEQLIDEPIEYIN